MTQSAKPNTDGPTLYGPLIDLARQQPQRMIEERLVKAARTEAAAISSLLGEAYTQGLRDGFQQGVQAAIDAEGRAA